MAAFSKRHYEAIARLLGERRRVSGDPWSDGYETAREGVARDLADLFARDNPQGPERTNPFTGRQLARPGFDRARFLKACGVPE